MIKKILILCIICHTFILPVNADKYVYYGEEVENWENSWQNLLDTLPDALREDVSQLSFVPGESITNNRLFSLEYWKNILLGNLCDTFTTATGSLVTIVGMLLILGISRTISSSSPGFFTLCGDLCMTLTLMTVLHKILLLIQTFLQQICTIMTAMVPVMSAISISAGEVTTASVHRIGLMLFITSLNQIQRWVFAPLGEALCSLCIISCVCTQVPLGGFIGSLRKLFTTLFSLMMLAYTFVYGMQTSLARSADSLGLRTMKFLLGSFIPIVGGTVADAFSAIREGLGYVRIMAGFGGIIILIYMVLPTALTICVYDMVLNCSHTAADVLGCGQSAKLLSETRSILHIFSSLVWIAIVFFLFAIILFTKTAVQAP